MLLRQCRHHRDLRDLSDHIARAHAALAAHAAQPGRARVHQADRATVPAPVALARSRHPAKGAPALDYGDPVRHQPARAAGMAKRSEEHTSELQSLMRISYAVFCLKKKKNTQQPYQTQYTLLM